MYFDTQAVAGKVNPAVGPGVLPDVIWIGEGLKAKSEESAARNQRRGENHIGTDSHPFGKSVDSINQTLIRSC